MDHTSTLYLIPIPISEGAFHTLSLEVAHHTIFIKYYFVENVRTARRFLKDLNPAIVIDDLHFSEIDKHEGADIETLKKWLGEGHKVGVISEAGCPGIADPGAELVAIAHKMNVKVIPFVGPNSIILALMASGLNGQSFCFNGYLPIKEPLRSQKIKQTEQLSRKENQTQIFIETPYRNNNIVDDLIKNCQENTRLCIAQNITAPDQYISTLTIGEWKRQRPELPKQPAVFLLHA